MQPITVHNIPTPPREVQLAFNQLSASWFGDEDGWDPTDMEYCAIVYDSGAELSHRIMMIEFTVTGVAFHLFCSFMHDELESVAVTHDKNVKIQTIS